LWCNWQTEAHLIFRPKPRNRNGDFDARITTPELPILRPRLGNPPPPWFWGPTKKPTAGFKAKLEETVATSFEAKLEKTIAAGFEAKPIETVAVGFEAKPLETVATGYEAKPVMRPNNSQTVAIGFEAQTDENPSGWFWGQTTDNPSTIVLRLNQETHTPHLHVHDADRTRCPRPLDRPATEYPTYKIIPGPLHQVSYSCHDPRHYTPCCTYHLHTMRQENMILQMKQR
jgi:hypothetical protein